MIWSCIKLLAMIERDHLQLCVLIATSPRKVCALIRVKSIGRITIRPHYQIDSMLCSNAGHSPLASPGSLNNETI
jgi:hypothetical protein